MASPFASLADARADWTRLAAASGNVFSTWEWARTWLRCRGAAEDECVPLALRDEAGAVVAILPLVFSSLAGLKLARIAGHGPADQLGPICAPEDRREVAEAIARLAADGQLGRVFLAERLDRGEGWPEAIGARPLLREPSPVLDLRGRDWEGYLAERSSNFRSQVRRAERKLIREHGLAFRLTDSPAALQADFGTLVRLHRDRWGNESDAFDDELEGFHREFAGVALERGWLRLWVAEAEGAPIAAWYGFRFEGAESFYQAGRDPAWERSKAGFVLLAHTIRAAFEDGMREYRFLRGGETYKSRFTDSDGAVETVALGAGAIGRALAGGAARLAGGERGRRLLARLGR